MRVDDRPGTAGRFAGLDGLRAFAVAAVVFFHADFYRARGGYLGVDLFFVISGFLITSLIAREVEATGSLALRAFYWRRAKRLLPASLFMTASVVVIAACMAPDALAHLRRDVIASLFYATNWELLLSGTSYFEAMGRPPLLQHLWSLAIEEQFYLLWAPLSLIVLPRYGRRRLATVAAGLAVASVVTMGVLAIGMGYPGNGDPSRLYFGTDTHGFSLLLGAAFGLRWTPRRGSRRVGIVRRGLWWLLGTGALAFMVALFASMGENTSFLYPWGLLMASVAGIALIAAATHPDIAFGRLLDNAPMRWIGERSYGIYLWHWPVFMLTRPDADLGGWTDEAAFALRACLSLAVADISYRFIEMPVRQGSLDRLLSAPGRRAGRSRISVACAALMTTFVTAFILVRAPAESVPAADLREALELDIPPLTVAAEPIRPIASVPARPTPHVAAAPAQNDDDDQTYTGRELTAVGDSVVLGSSRLLKAYLPGTDLHATIGWQATDILRRLRALEESHELRPVVVLHLGTNGYVTERQLREMLRLLSDARRVVLVNTRVPRRWMTANNELIDRVAPDFPNVRIVRWSDSASDRPGYFISDRVHLTAAGQRALIADIMRVGGLRHHAPDIDVSDISHVNRKMTGDFSPTLVIADATNSGSAASALTYTYTTESVLRQTFRVGQRGEVVRDLQRILGAERNGFYSQALRKKHVAYLQAHALSEELAATDP